MSRRAVFDLDPTFFANDDDLADERAHARKRGDFERLAAQEYRDTGTVLVWGEETDNDDTEDDA